MAKATKAASAAPETAAPETAANEAAFDLAKGMDPAKMVETMRSLAEQGLERNKLFLDQLRANSDQMRESMQAGVDTAQQHSSKMSAAAVDAMRQQAEMTFGHLEKMMSVKTLSDAVELQTEFLRKQAELAVAGAKDFQSMASSAAEDMSKPMKDAAEKAMKSVGK